MSEKAKNLATAALSAVALAYDVTEEEVLSGAPRWADEAPLRLAWTMVKEAEPTISYAVLGRLMGGRSRWAVQRGIRFTLRQAASYRRLRERERYARKMMKRLGGAGA